MIKDLLVYCAGQFIYNVKRPETLYKIHAVYVDSKGRVTARWGENKKAISVDSRWKIKYRPLEEQTPEEALQILQLNLKRNLISRGYEKGILSYSEVKSRYSQLMHTVLPINPRTPKAILYALKCGFDLLN